MRGHRMKKRLHAANIGIGTVPGLTSVVLPVYNGAAYLGEAIDSVLAQTELHWELWIVDDGSCDDSGAIADRYAARDERIRVIHQTNQKLPAALNRGFAAAKGEYYTWLSADNRMLPHCLAALSGALRRHSDWDMVFGNEYLIDENGKRITGHGWFELPTGSGRVCFPPATPLLNTVANNTIGAAFLYRAGVDAVLGGYSQNLYLLEDYDYFMRVNSLFRIRHIKEQAPIYEYRFHADSLTAHDTELGITARRPQLMRFDALRRRALHTPLSVCLIGASPTQKHVFLRSGFAEDRDGVPVAFCSKESVRPSDGYTVTKTPGGYAVACGDLPLAALKTLNMAADFLWLHIYCARFRREEAEFFND